MNEGTLGFGKKELIRKIIETHWKIKPEQKKFNYNELLFVIQAMMTEDGKEYLTTRRTGLKGFHIFREFAKLLLYRNLANYDSMIMMTADKGTGKSSAAIMLARQWCKLIGIKFNPKRHIAYNNADVMNKIDMLKKFEPLICDEAIRFASSEDWAKRENKELKKKLGQIRTKHLLYILCFPLKIAKVEKTYLESYTNYWIDLFGRGVGAIYVKDRNPASDSWKVKDFAKLGAYNEFSALSKVQDVLKKHGNFWQIIKFPKPSEKLYAKYLAVREANVYDDANVMASVSKDDIHKALLVLSLRDILMNDDTITMNRIVLHIRNEYDINISKQVIQAAIEDAKQLVTKVKESAEMK